MRTVEQFPPGPWALRPDRRRPEVALPHHATALGAPPSIAVDAPSHPVDVPVADATVDAPSHAGARVAAPALPAREPAARVRAAYAARMLGTDAIVILASLALGVGLESALGTAGTAASLIAAAALGTAALVALAALRTRDHRVASGTAELRRTALALAAAFGAASIALLVALPAPPRVLVVAALPTMLLGVLSGRWAWRSWFRRVHVGTARSSVLLVGDREGVEAAARRLHDCDGVYRVLGAVLDDAEDCDDGRRANELFAGEAPREVHGGGDRPSSLVVDGLVVPVLGTVGTLRASALDAGADAVLVVGTPRTRDGFVRSLAWELEGSGVELALVDRLDGIAAARTRLQAFDGLRVLHVDVARHRGAHHRIKRAFDVLVVSLLLVAAAPLLGIIALWVRRDGGESIYRQQRIGRDGVPFTMYKFRSMVPDAERYLAELQERNEGAGVLFKIKDDPRVTEVGRFLRRHSLDELPQLWNVLRGEMSLVGPRPPLPSEVDAYDETSRRRLLVRPGLTGLWQVSGRSDLDWDESISLDLFYVENWSLGHDLSIIARTAGIVVSPSGAY